ncbi:MAG: hypothetical protein EHM28_08170, partial [Spirochaetaceae bacterium]
MKNRLVINSIIIMVLCLVVTSNFAQDSMPGTDLGADRNLLEVYYERAERAATEDQWRRIVDEGIAVVCAQWESAVGFALDETEADETLALLQNELEAEESDRITEWLLKRFFESVDTGAVEQLYAAIGAANLDWLYEKDENGEIKFDSAGDPVLKTESGLYTDSDTAEGDSVKWRTFVEDNLEEILDAWESSAGIASPELLAAGIDMGDAGSISLATYKEGLGRELRRIFYQEEANFLNRRLYDQYSLRNKSDAQAAREMTSQLISEAEEETEAGIKRVRDGLESMEMNISVKGLEATSEEWLETFTEAFETGLDKWETAQEAFLRQRGEWEEDASEQFELGQEEWAKAFTTLRQARQKWESQIVRVRDEGLLLWDEKSETLRQSLAEAMAKLEAGVKDRVGGVSAQINALMDMYLQAHGVYATAANSIEFWETELKGIFELANSQLEMLDSELISDETFNHAITSGDDNVNWKEDLTALANRISAAIEAGETYHSTIQGELEDNYDTMMEMVNSAAPLT